MKINAIIFDMDGVIFDGEPLHSKSLELLLREYNKTPIFNKQELLHTVGISGEKGYQEFIQRYNPPDDLYTVKNKRRNYYELLLSKGINPMPGLIELLDLLKKANYKIGLATNRSQKHALLIVKHLKIKHYYRTFVSPTEMIKAKPAPDLYLQAAKNLKVKPVSCVVIEDSESGVMAGKLAGMKVITVPNKYTLHQNFSKADRVVNRLKGVTIQLLQSL